MRSSQIEKLILFAESQVGTREWPPYSNDIKYNTWFYGQEVRDDEDTNYAYCVVFDSYCFAFTGLASLFCGGEKKASCTKVVEYAKAHGQWFTSGFRRGDIPIYHWPTSRYPYDHTGIIKSVDAYSVTAIEGNTSIGGGNEGVAEVVRDLDVIAGVFRPDYAYDIREYADDVDAIAKLGIIDPIKGADYWKGVTTSTIHDLFRSAYNRIKAKKSGHYDDVVAAVNRLYVVGVIGAPKYWIEHHTDVKYCGDLLVKLANATG